jgi:hypothetical protein
LFQITTYEPVTPLSTFVFLNKPRECTISISSKELRTIWDTLSSFCAFVNRANIEQQKISKELFLDVMASVMYQLSNMAHLPGSSDEPFRLAMLVFSTQTFLQWRDLRMPMNWLISEYMSLMVRTTLQDTALTDPWASLWMMTILRLALPSAPSEESELLDVRLVSILNTCNMGDWDGVKICLGSYLWIDIICDKPGRRMFERICAQRPLAAET